MPSRSPTRSSGRKATGREKRSTCDNLARIHEERGQHDKAERVWRYALKLYDGSPSGRSRRSRIRSRRPSRQARTPRRTASCRSTVMPSAEPLPKAHRTPAPSRGAVASRTGAAYLGERRPAAFAHAGAGQARQGRRSASHPGRGSSRHRRSGDGYADSGRTGDLGTACRDPVPAFSRPEDHRPGNGLPDAHAHPPNLSRRLLRCRCRAPGRYRDPDSLRRECRVHRKGPGARAAISGLGSGVARDFPLYEIFLGSRMSGSRGAGRRASASTSLRLRLHHAAAERSAHGPDGRHDDYRQRELCGPVAFRFRRSPTWPSAPRSKSPSRAGKVVRACGRLKEHRGAGGIPAWREESGGKAVSLRQLRHEAGQGRGGYQRLCFPEGDSTGSRGRRSMSTMKSTPTEAGPRVQGRRRPPPSSTSRTSGFPSLRGGGQTLAMEDHIKDMLRIKFAREDVGKRQAKDCGEGSGALERRTDEFGCGVERELWRAEAALHGSRGRS